MLSNSIEMMTGGPAEAGYRAWLDAAVSCVGEVFSVTFGVDPPQKMGEVDALEGQFRGVTLALISDDEDVELVFAATADAAQALTRLMFCVEPGEPDLPDEDVGDAVGEIANMIAGGVKDRLSGSRTIRLGLPMQFSGQVRSAEADGSRLARMSNGHVSFVVGVFHRRVPEH